MTAQTLKHIISRPGPDPHEPPPPCEPTLLPVVSIGVSDASGSESPDAGGATPGAIRFTVSRSGSTVADLIVALHPFAGAAIVGADYAGGGAGVTIPAGQSSATFSLTPVDDGLFERSEKVIAILAASSNYWLSGAFKAQGAIADNDIDLAIDSNNDGRFGKADDAVEDVTGDDARPGKVMLISDSDSDRDGIPDFADGFDLLEDFTSDDQSTATRLVPIRFAVPDADYSSAQIRVTYSASDPAALEASLDDPYVLPDGSMRLWRTAGSAARDKRSISAGGDYLSPGVYTAAQLGLSGGGTTTFYVEALTVSEAVADVAVLFEFKPNSSASTWQSDQVRLTATRIEILGRGYGESEFRVVDRLIASNLSVDPNANQGFTRGAFEVHKVRVTDPRTSGISQLFVSRQPLPLSPQSSRYETPEFVAVRPGPQVNFAQSYPRVTLHSDSAQLRYNPAVMAAVAGDVSEPPAHIAALGAAKELAVEQMENENWSGGNNTGAFGIEVHRRASLILSAADQRWMADLYVNRISGQIVSLGASPPGGVTGTTQVDLIYMKQGQLFQVGQVFDANKVTDLAEIKTSIDKTILPPQLNRLKALMGGREIWVSQGTERRWTAGSGWHLNKRFKNLIRLLGILGAASAAWNLMDTSAHATELETLRDSIEEIKARNYAAMPDGETAKLLDQIDMIHQVGDYLSHYTPDDTIIDLIKVGTMYKIIADWDASDE